MTAIILSKSTKGIATRKTSMSRLQITGLHVYPVKSMKGIAVDEAILTTRGLLHDRIWMVVRPDGRFVTQRGLPRLALVNTRLEDTGVTLSAEGHGSIAIPFDSDGGSAVATQVWGDACEAVDVGPEVSHWLTRAVGSPETLRVVRMAAGFRRPQNTPERFGADTTTHFADSAPFLVANESSLAELNRELVAGGHEAVPMNRFRPNIVVRGLEPFAEHRARELAGEGWCLSLVDACERCLVTTIDQQTAQRNPDREPYLTLRRINPVPGPKPAPAFAQYAILGAGAGQRIALGSPLTATW
jgi:uncharacterized protein YcbX